MLLQRRPLHQPERGGGLSNHSRSGRQSHQGSGCRQATLCEMPHRYRGMDNRDRPSDTLGIRLSDNSRRMPCCELQEGVRQSSVLSVSIHRGILEHLQCLLQIVHVPDCTNSCIIPARAWWGSRTCPLSPRRARWLLRPSTPMTVRCWLFQSLLQQSLASHWLFLLIRLTTTFTITSFSSVRLSAIISVKSNGALNDTVQRLPCSNVSNLSETSFSSLKSGWQCPSHCVPRKTSSSDGSAIGPLTTVST